MSPNMVNTNLSFLLTISRIENIKTSYSHFNFTGWMMHFNWKNCKNQKILSDKGNKLIVLASLFLIRFANIKKLTKKKQNKKVKTKGSAVMLLWHCHAMLMQKRDATRKSVNDDR